MIKPYLVEDENTENHSPTLAKMPPITQNCLLNTISCLKLLKISIFQQIDPLKHHDHLSNIRI